MPHLRVVLAILCLLCFPFMLFGMKKNRAVTLVWPAMAAMLWANEIESSAPALSDVLRWAGFAVMAAVIVLEIIRRRRVRAG